MQATLTKFFPFSASHARGPAVVGHNYVLGVTVDYVADEQWAILSREIHRAVIEPVSSRDLGTHVDFLKGTEITEKALLEAFWRKIEPLARRCLGGGLCLHSLTLQSDAQSVATLLRPL